MKIKVTTEVIRVNMKDSKIIVIHMGNHAEMIIVAVAKQ